MPSICSSAIAERSADRRGSRNADQEPGQHARAVLAREPGREEIGDAGEEARFGDAEQKAQRIEAVHVVDEGDRRPRPGPS